MASTLTSTIENASFEENSDEVVSAYPVAIDHPGQNLWNKASLASMYESNQSALRARFEGSEEDVQSLIAAVEHANAKTQTYRHMHEIENLGRLNLQPAERQDYLRFAGDPEHVGRFIHWFGGVAMRATSKVALDLGGKRQFGDWECTHDLDGMARSIPSKLLHMHEDSDQGAALPSIKIYGEKPKNDPLAAYNGFIEYVPDVTKNYLFLPQLKHSVDDKFAFDYGVVRRRRPVADIYSQRAPTIELFKESHGLVVLSQLPKAEGTAITGIYKNMTPEQYSRNNMNNSLPAVVAGRAFERAITEEKGATRYIIPISAHYVMVARQAINAASL